jgi:hypothetical protein
VISPVDDLKSQRRPFQFSLRKLLLWTAVWSAYLGVMRWLQIPLSAAFIVTMYFMVFVAVRIKWGLGRGLLSSICLMAGLACACFGAATLGGGIPLVGIVIGLPIVCLCGVYLGACSFLPVHFLMSAVDWLDNLMQTKPPQNG